jgi:pimeloyl-ACP methyl ester carboxylesterase
VRLKTIGVALLACLALGLAASWVAGSMMSRGEHWDGPASAPPASDFLLTAADGVRIAATYRPGRAPHSPAVMLLHGVGASRRATSGNATWLAGQGYATLAIDFRGHGSSDLRARSFGLHEARDAEAAYRWLKQRQGGAAVAVIGISLGGAATLLGENGPLPADALILHAVNPDIRRAIRNRIAARLGWPPAIALEPLLSFQSWPRHGVWPGRLAPLDALRRYRGPVMVVGGLDDLWTTPEETREMFAAAPGARHLWLAPGHDHGQTSDLADDAYRARLLAFLNSTIGRP